MKQDDLLNTIFIWCWSPFLLTWPEEAWDAIQGRLKTWASSSMTYCLAHFWRYPQVRKKRELLLMVLCSSQSFQLHRLSQSVRTIRMKVWTEAMATIALTPNIWFPSCQLWWTGNALKLHGFASPPFRTKQALLEITLEMGGISVTTLQCSPPVRTHTFLITYFIPRLQVPLGAGYQFYFHRAEKWENLMIWRYGRMETGKQRKEKAGNLMWKVKRKTENFKHKGLIMEILTIRKMRGLLNNTYILEYFLHWKNWPLFRFSTLCP